MEILVTVRRITTLACAALAAASLPATAQVTKFNTVNLLTTVVRGVDVAHDDTGGALVVSAQNYVFGQCISATGAPGPTFAIKPFAPSGYPFGSFPRARFNPTNRNFLVVWPEEEGPSNLALKARTISCPSGAMGPIQQIGVSPWGESGAALDWSSLSGKYLVAWKSVAGSNPVVVQLVNADATPSGSPVVVSSGFGRDPGVVWNPLTNEFGVSYSGETDTGAYSAFVAVPAGSPSRFRRTTFNVIGGGKTYLTDLTYNINTQHYVMSWFQLSNGPFAKIAELDNTGALVGFGTASSMGSYDALSLAFNQTSGTFLLSGINGTDELQVAEMNAHGVRFAPELTVSTGFRAVRYPRVDATANAANWLSVMSRNSFQGTGLVVFHTATTGGGPAGSYTSGGGGTTTGGGGGTTTGGCTSVQPGPGWTCVNGGWLPPTTSGGTTSTGGCTSVQPGPGWTCVNGGWLPPTTSGGTTSTGSCTSVQPGTGWTCVNGNWLPSTTSSGGSTSTSTCTSVQPGTGWTCVNGNWLPPGTTGGTTSTTSCKSVQPGTGWTCVNGNWLPPGTTSGTTSTSSCTSVQPGTGWTCVNGNWLPPGTTSTSSCTSVQPGAGWVCQNGSWLPPDSSLLASLSTSAPANDGTCSGTAPVSNWICQKGNWLPPDSPLIIR
jgi:hypothetical protein